MITYQTQNTDMPAIDQAHITAWIEHVALTYGRRVGEIAYIFVDDETILNVNRQFLQHDYYTDIITFDYCHADTISGDVFISLDTVKSNAQELGVDYVRELLRVIIHGVLHLCGEEDKGPGLRAKMEAAEDRAIALFWPQNGGGKMRFSDKK